jgi:hypothetical protein
MFFAEVKLIILFDRRTLGDSLLHDIFRFDLGLLPDLLLLRRLENGVNEGLEILRWRSSD